MAQKITKTSVALEDKDRIIVNRLVEERGLNFSSALRFIIRSWADNQNVIDEFRKQNTDQGNGHENQLVS